MGFEIPVLAGVLILAVWFFCVLRVQSTAREVFAPITLLLACGISFIVIQVGVHGESMLDSDLRAFMTWMMGLMIVQSLILRSGFYIRFPIVLFLIGIATLPFLGFNSGEVDMARVEIAVQGGLTHPAGFAEWFGFCAVFFAVFGIETRDLVLRTLIWGLMVACLFLVTLSVERGPLFETALALILAFRRQLKRGFLPLFVLTLFVGTVSFTGIFERAMSQYSERGFEDTGREILWPAAIDRIQSAPFFGEGKSNALIQLSANKVSPPHNNFLYFALSSGIIPLFFFSVFWFRVSWRTVFHSQTNDSFSLPYLAFTWPSLMLGDLGFMNISGLLITAILTSRNFARKEPVPVARPARGRPWLQQKYNSRMVGSAARRNVIRRLRVE